MKGAHRLLHSLVRWALVLTTVGALGCVENLGVSNMQLLDEGVPQSFVLRMEPAALWDVLVKESKMYGDCGTLAASGDDGVVSWCESVVLWRDLRQDTIASTASDRRKHEVTRRAALRELGRGVALTTAWVRPAATGSELVIRRVYFGLESLGGVAHSRGTYELDLQRNESIASIHSYNLLYGLGLDELERYPERIMKITKKDVLQVAKKYLRPDRAVCAVVTP